MVESLVEQVSWLTPTSLFVILNIVIGTILVSNAFNKKPHQQVRRDHDHDQSSAYTTPSRAQQQPQLGRAPSFFSRVTSFNMTNNYYPYSTADRPYYHEDDQQQQPQQPNPSQSFFSRITSLDFGRTDAGLDRRNEEYKEPESVPVERDLNKSHVGWGNSDNNDSNVQQPGPVASLFSRVASFKYSGRAQQPNFEEYKESEPEPTARDINKSHVQRNSNKVSPAEPVRRTVPRAPYLLSRLASFDFSSMGRSPQSGAEVEARDIYVSREKEVSQSAEGTNLQDKVVKKKNKAKSFGRETTTSFKTDEEVDTKADDFINRFKQQLKLQRIESLLRQRSSPN